MKTQISEILKIFEIYTPLPIASGCPISISWDLSV